MSQVNIYRTGKLTDKQIIELLTSVEKQFGAVSTNVHMGTLAVDYKDSENAKLFKGSSTSITRGDIQTESYKFHVKFRRGICADAGAHENDREASPYFDEIILLLGTHRNANQQAPTPQEVIACDKVLQRFVTRIVPENIEKGGNSALDLLQGQISSLSAQYQDMITGIDKRRAELDKEHDRRMIALEAKHETNQQDLQTQKAAESKKLQKRIDALDKREQSLDNRDHMHVRRGLRENINEDISTRLQETIVPTSAHLMRWGVFIMALTASAFLGLVSVMSIAELSRLGVMPAETAENAQDIASVVAISGWVLTIKAVLSSLGAVGSFFYAMSWLRRLYLDDVRTQRELEKYAYDINRASWAIETMMEMQIGNQTLPPQTWIESVCRNLFESEDSKHNDIQNPIEALLTSSAKVEIGPEGTKFELGKRGAQKLAKKASNG